LNFWVCLLAFERPHNTIFYRIYTVLSDYYLKIESYNNKSAGLVILACGFIGINDYMINI
jgi:hypothetical protein